ncbi:MAG TPA: type II toxin-antitoxin system VapC family toxin [Longimicrobiales bacterium]|nr:type II toxin-antitoxin system VapC family toxin [Longimicrobiales bacterium]
MILVDTSVWIGHFRRSDRLLMELLEAGEVLTHPFVVGELACGNLPAPEEVLGLFQQLPTAPSASDPEALHFIERHRLMGRGIGYVDVHLLASAALADGARVWTADARLAAAASRLFLSYESH